MLHNFPEVINSAAEAISLVNAIRFPPEPVERTVVATVVSAERQVFHLSLVVVRIVDAHECGAKSKG